MSLLASLVRAYERLPEPAPFGLSVEKIGLLISLKPDGRIAQVVDLRLPDARGKPQPRDLAVPEAVKRSSGIAPNFLWDKTAYVLGVTAGSSRRTRKEHAAFVAHQEAALQGADDEGLCALLQFLRDWTPEQFQAPTWREDFKDLNVVFALEADRRANVFLHDRPAARARLSRRTAAGEAGRICLVSGEKTAIARLHTSIKGVWGAQSSGASLVSYNAPAFESYGHEQGDNAQIGERAAFAYATALNHFLRRNSGHRQQIGDASIVFWADAADAVAASLAEQYMAEMMEPKRDDETAAENRIQTARIQAQMRRIARGEPLAKVEPTLGAGVRYYVLGLAPNAARLSVRFYFEDEFSVLADNYRAYVRDLALEPGPPGSQPQSFARFVACTAPARRDPNGSVKFDLDAVSPLLSGELLRAALTGRRIPRSLLSLLVMRVRGDGYLNHARVSLIKAVVLRDLRLAGRATEDYLMRSDPDDPNPARRLGQLFAVIERAQSAALGDKINATVADKFLGAASSTPRQVMPALILNARNHHIKRLRNGHSDATWIKDPGHARSVAYALDRDIGALVAPFDDGFPAELSTQDQGLFLVGYYQERWSSSGDEDEAANAEPTEE